MERSSFFTTLHRCWIVTLQNCVEPSLWCCSLNPVGFSTRFVAWCREPSCCSLWFPINDWVFMSLHLSQGRSSWEPGARSFSATGSWLCQKSVGAWSWQTWGSSVKCTSLFQACTELQAQEFRYPGYPFHGPSIAASIAARGREQFLWWFPSEVHYVKRAQVLR